MPGSDKKKERKSEYRIIRLVILSELDRIMASEDCDVHPNPAVRV